MEIGGADTNDLFFKKSADFLTDFSTDYSTDNYQACLIKSVENHYFGRFPWESVGI